ncbi:MAG: 23S rRNA (uracil(1939)-C(5))-methyltransferase RlmD [Bacteroidetes bacterium]|nr:23S rRNA (uracil(1939)-C(5))-methyltransferase RlmD [Bacteroidota bacterium]
MLKRGSEITLEIEKFADRGKSIARLDGYVVFVPGGIPGDRLRVRIVKTKRKYAEAVTLEVLKPSPYRTEPVCSYFGTCGGCKWQHVTYEAQLEAKTQSVREALEHHGGFEKISIAPAIGANPIYRYRNKMEYSFSAQRWLTSDEIASGRAFDTSFALGLHVPGNFSKVLDLTECHLHSETGVRVVNFVRRFVREKEWRAWHVRNQTGFLRYLVLRSGHATGEFMVNLVTSDYDSERMESLSSELRKAIPEVTTFVNTINRGVAQTAYGDEIHTIFGPGVIHDRIGPHIFEIASNAFFQTNTAQAERLYDVAAGFAELKQNDLVYDLYSGAGAISIYVANRVSRVVGVELVPEAVENATRNAKTNSIENVSFFAGDMMRLFDEEFIAKHGRPDVLIVDPPRAGMHPRVVKQIRRLRPERFVYLSCNPLSQARDLKMLADTFSIEAVQPVDLFPHTHHIENVVKLRAR